MLSAHRKSLEAEGIESGRDVHRQYRNELKEMNRAMAERRGEESKEEVEVPDAHAAYLDRIAEHIGEFLTEPSPTQIFIVVVSVLFVLALAMGIALQ